jgi:radical SAM superfamily enzyme YgiQ (UPF0313 family)
MRIAFLYAPPFQIPAPGEPGLILEEGPYEGFILEQGLSGDETTIPFGLLTLAAQSIAAGHDVTVLNLYCFAWKDLIQVMENLPADIFGLSCLTTNRRGTLALARLIKELYPNSQVVLGGPHASALPRELLLHSRAVDGVVMGEGESTFEEFIDRFRGGMPLRPIPGMVLRDGDDILIGPPRERIDDLDSLASPYDHFKGNVIVSARGCPEDCTFCGSPAMWGRKVRSYSAEYILRMLDQIVRVHKYPFVGIKDDTFTYSRRRVLEICEGIRRSDLRFLWSCDTRVDVLDEEILLSMRSAGCQRISIGVESGSPRILKNINKRITPEKVLSATRMIKKFGFDLRFYIMGANRDESSETLEATIDLIKEAKPSRFTFAHLSLFPGTKEFAIAAEKQMVNTEMFFNKDYPYFTHPLPGGNMARLNEAYAWFDRHMNRPYWDYDLTNRKSIAENYPTLPAANMDLGVALFHERDFEEARRYMNRALEMGYPLPGLAHDYQACIAAEHGDIHETIAFLSKAKALGSRLADTNLMSLRRWLSEGPGKNGKPVLKTTDVLSAAIPQEMVQPFNPAPIVFRHQKSRSSQMQPAGKGI